MLLSGSVRLELKVSSFAGPEVGLQEQVSQLWQQG